MKKIVTLASAMFLLMGCSSNGNDKDSSNNLSDSVSSQMSAQESISASEALASDENSSANNVPEVKEEVKAEPEDNDSMEADLPAIKANITKFYEGAVIGAKGGIPWTKSSLSRYCTSNFLKKLKSENEYDGDNGYAVWILRGDPMDSDSRDKVLSVEQSGDDSVTVTYLDCGYTCKTKLYLKKEGDTWKINNCKLISQSSKSRYPELNW